jgi:hypothetical protein
VDSARPRVKPHRPVRRRRRAPDSRPCSLQTPAPTSGGTHDSDSTVSPVFGRCSRAARPVCGRPGSGCACAGGGGHARVRRGAIRDPPVRLSSSFLSSTWTAATSPGSTGVRPDTASVPRAHCAEAWPGVSPCVTRPASFRHSASSHSTAGGLRHTPARRALSSVLATRNLRFARSKITHCRWSPWRWPGGTRARAARWTTCAGSPGTGARAPPSALGGRSRLMGTPGMPSGHIRCPGRSR